MSVMLSPDTKRWLVTRAEEILDNAGPNLQMGQVSQLRNMLQISQRDSEVPVLVNFLRYQVGRHATRRFWEPIFDAVVQTLEEIDERCRDEYGEQEEKARSLAIQHFFGFMVRHYVYLQVRKDAIRSGPRGGGNRPGNQGRQRRY